MVWAQVILYKAVVQTILLYGRSIWVVTGAMLKLLEGFQHMLVRQIVGKTAQRMVGGEWEWSPAADALEIAGLYIIKELIQRLQATIVENIYCWPIYEI